MSESRPWLDAETPALAFRVADDWWHEQDVVSGFAIDFACACVVEWERKRIIALARLRGKEGEFPYGEELEWFARELEAEDG